MYLSSRAESRSVAGTKQWKCQDHRDQKHIGYSQSTVQFYRSRVVPGTVGHRDHHHPSEARTMSCSSHGITACVVGQSAPITRKYTKICPFVWAPLPFPRSPGTVGHQKYHPPLGDRGTSHFPVQTSDTRKDGHISTQVNTVRQTTCLNTIMNLERSARCRCSRLGASPVCKEH